MSNIFYGTEGFLVTPGPPTQRLVLQFTIAAGSRPTATSVFPSPQWLRAWLLLQRT